MVGGKAKQVAYNAEKELQPGASKKALYSKYHERPADES